MIQTFSIPKGKEIKSIIGENGTVTIVWQDIEDMHFARCIACGIRFKDGETVDGKDNEHYHKKCAEDFEEFEHCYAQWDEKWYQRILNGIKIWYKRK